MSIDLSFAWVWLLLLGALHGINPAMGWLFAVARGLQEQRERAVWQTLLPLALGHALAIGVVVVLGVLVGLMIPLEYLKWAVAATLLTFGIYRLVSSRHPVWGGMRVGARDLTIWSFLMASAHGAGLMVLPFILRGDSAPNAAPPVAAALDPHADHAAVHAFHAPAGPHPLNGVTHADHVAPLPTGIIDEQLLGLVATLLHTAGYLLVTGLVALIVYRKLGLRLLRAAWINLDLIWAGALIVTAVLTPML